MPNSASAIVTAAEPIWAVGVVVVEAGPGFFDIKRRAAARAVLFAVAHGFILAANLAHLRTHVAIAAALLHSPGRSSQLKHPLSLAVKLTTWFASPRPYRGRGAPRRRTDRQPHAWEDQVGRRAASAETSAREPGVQRTPRRMM
jgi:hypothetical protein